MGNKKEDVVDFNLKELFWILIKRKWLLIGTFIIILIAGVLFSIFRAPQYSLSSSIKLTENYFYYNDFIYKFFPDEANELWIFPKDQEYILGNRKLVSIGEYMKSDEFLEEVSKELNYDISKNELKETIGVGINADSRILTLSTVYNEKDKILRVNKEIIDLYIGESKTKLNEVREDLISEIEIKLDSIKEEIDNLFKSLNEDEEEFILMEIDSNYSDYDSLDEIRTILINNKDLFIDRIEVFKEPETSNINEITNLKRDVIISFFSALVVSLIVVFVVNYFKS